MQVERNEIIMVSVKGKDDNGVLGVNSAIFAFQHLHDLNLVILERSLVVSFQKKIIE